MISGLAYGNNAQNVQTGLAMVAVGISSEQPITFVAFVHKRLWSNTKYSLIHLLNYILSSNFCFIFWSDDLCFLLCFLLSQGNTYKIKKLYLFLDKKICLLFDWLIDLLKILKVSKFWLTKWLQLASVYLP